MPFAIVNFKELRRAMSVTPQKPSRLTRNGLVHDHVTYRWNREGVEDVLDAGDRQLPAGLRTPGTAMVMVSIRTWDDDIDMIEVFDPETGTYHEFWSTEPEYTSGLSRWEHHQYLDMIKAGKGGASSEVDRLLLKGASLREQDEIMPQLAFRDRAAGAALVEAEGYRRACGARAGRPGFAEVPELGATMTPGGQERDDMPTTPPQTTAKDKDKSKGRRGRGRKKVPNEHRAPPRDDDYGTASVGRAPRVGSGKAGRHAEGDKIRSGRLARWATLGAPSEPGAAGGTADLDEVGGGKASTTWRTTICATTLSRTRTRRGTPSPTTKKRRRRRNDHGHRRSARITASAYERQPDA